MSSHIIDELKAVKIPKEMFGRRDDFFILCELGGDNNMIDSRTNKRARNWSAIAIGESWQVIEEICKTAGYFEGGMVKLSTGRATPEGFIRKCRKALESPDILGQSELRIYFQLRFNETEIKDGAKWQIEDLTKAGAVATEEERYGTKETVYNFTSSDFPVWLKGIHGRAWRNVEVSGPRTV
jgi:hypothetical protein